MDRDAYLVLGAAETVVGLTERFRPIVEHRGLYISNTAAVDAASTKPGPTPIDAPAIKQRPALRVVAGAK